MDQKLIKLRKSLDAVNTRSGFELTPPSATASAQRAAIDALQSAFANVGALEQVSPGAAALEEVQNLADETTSAITALQQQLDVVAAASRGVEGAAAETAARLELRVDAARRDFSEKISEIAAALTGLEERFGARDTLNPCGCYDPKRTYNRLDLVELKGSSWICMADGTQEKPSKHSKRWMLSAGKGASAFGGGGTVINQGFNILAEDADSITVEI